MKCKWDFRQGKQAGQRKLFALPARTLRGQISGLTFFFQCRRLAAGRHRAALLYDGVSQLLLLLGLQIGNLRGRVNRQHLFVHHFLQLRLQLGQTGDLLDVGTALAGPP